MTKARPRPQKASRASKSTKGATKSMKSSSPKRPAARPSAGAGGPKVVRLKPLYMQLGRTIEQLQKLPATDRVKFAIERLSQCRAEFDSICGPTMDVPPDPPPA